MKIWEKSLFIILGLFLSTGICNAAEDNEQRDYLEPVKVIEARIMDRLSKPMPHADLELIMEGNDFYGSQPVNIRWDSDNSRFWFQWKQWDDSDYATYEYHLGMKRLTRLSSEDADQVPSPQAIWDADHKRALWSVNDTVWLYEGEGKKSHRIISGFGQSPPPSEYQTFISSGMDIAMTAFPFPFFGSGTMEPVAFVDQGTKAVLFYDNNLFLVSLAKNSRNFLRKLTDIRTGSAPDETPPTQGQRFLREQQLKLFNTLKKRQDKRHKTASELQKNRPLPYYLNGWSVLELIPSPDLKYVSMMLYRSSPNSRTPEIANYITPSSYLETIPITRRVVDEPAEYKLLMIETASGKILNIDYGLTGKDPEPWHLKWREDSRQALLLLVNRENTERWLGVLEPDQQEGNSIRLRILAKEQDDVWVCWTVMEYFGWLPGNKNAWFISERTGWLQLHSVPLAGGPVTSLTRGEFLVLRPRLTPDRTSFVFNATLGSPFQMHTCIMPLESGKIEPLASGAGRTEVFLSPDHSKLAILASDSNHPYELYVKSTDAPGLGTKITDSPSPAFKSYAWIKPKIVFFRAGDGTMVPARLYSPENPHPKKPAVIFAHGAGWLHNVHHWWSGYSHEYCFHHLLMEKGYTVLDIDFRASAGYGRSWRTAIKDELYAGKVSDVVDGSKYLVKELGTDFDRIGIYGGSGGGMVTLMALFTASDYFGAGAALRSLPDVAIHELGNFMLAGNSPYGNEKAYFGSSAIYHAEGLKDPLLICHGLADINTTFLGVTRLVQRLIELRKTDWELAVYPMESHSFTEPSSWVDEYRRVLKLFETHLKK